MANPTHDDLIKALLSQPRLLEQFFRAFVPGVLEFADFSGVEYLDKEHARGRKRPRRAGDLLVKARWRSADTVFLIHIESQNRAEAIALERVGEYAYRDAIRYRLPVMPVLLLTYPRPLKPQSDTLTWTFGKVARLHLRCPVLHFARMDPTPHLAGGNVAALALSALMRLDPGQQVEAIAQTLAETLRQNLSAEEMEAASAFVRHYAPLDTEQLLQLKQRVRKLSETEPALAPMPALVNPFVELGKIEGRVEGRVEGRTEGELAMVLRLLSRKFPKIAPRVAKRVRTLDEARLLAFGEALLFFENERDCLDWVDRA